MVGRKKKKLATDIWLTSAINKTGQVEMEKKKAAERFMQE